MREKKSTTKMERKLIGRRSKVKVERGLGREGREGREYKGGRTRRGREA